MPNDVTTKHPMRRLLSNRRGLMTGVAALVGAGLARLNATDRAEAAHSGSDPTIIHAGQENLTSARTRMTMGSGASAPAIVGVWLPGGGSGEIGSADGVQGITNTAAGAAGVRGYANANGGYGVYGTSNGHFSSFGVRGESIPEGYAVFGKTTNGGAVRGEATNGGRGVEGIAVNNYGVYGQASNNVGVYGESPTTSGVQGVTSSSTDDSEGVYGSATSTTARVYGVFGQTSSTISDSSGVKGVASGGATNGVWGRHDGGAPSAAGVLGTIAGGSSANYGVWGQTGSSNANASGVYGEATTSGAPGNGVRGRSSAGNGVLGTSTNGIGVNGQSTNNIGVYGVSTNSYGCGGATSTPGYAGLFGYASVASAASFLGVNAAPGGTAGYFHGNVTVDGGFQVVNGPKNALVAHPDGSLRKMYCQESPEPWFEDFGTAQLQGGKATVRLDPDFAAVVRADQYSVFPIPEGACEGLYIAAKTPNSFEVRELRGGTSSVPFSYRLVARRKDDVGRRMEKVDLPKFDLRAPGPPATPPGQDKQPPR